MDLKMDQNGTTWHKLRDVLVRCVAFVFESSRQGRGAKKNSSSRSTIQRYPTLSCDLYQVVNFNFKVQKPSHSKNFNYSSSQFQNLGYLNYSMFPNKVCFLEPYHDLAVNFRELTSGARLY